MRGSHRGRRPGPRPTCAARSTSCARGSRPRDVPPPSRRGRAGRPRSRRGRSRAESGESPGHAGRRSARGVQSRTSVPKAWGCPGTRRSTARCRTERREDGDTERLRRLDRNPLGEDLVDREREVGVLLDEPSGSTIRSSFRKYFSSCIQLKSWILIRSVARRQPPQRAAGRPRRQQPRAAGPQARCLPRCRREARRRGLLPGCKDR